MDKTNGLQRYQDCVDSQFSRWKPKYNLYLALYARPKYPQTYHYALHISPERETTGPTVEETTKFHCKNIVQSNAGVVSIPWVYEAVRINPSPDCEPRLLVRILVGKVPSIELVERIFADTPVVQNDPVFNCVVWVQEALERLSRDEIGGKKIKFGWDEIQNTALEYVNEKKRQSRFESGWKGDASRVATFDMASGREVFP